jgi:hypothetical protein
MIFLFASFALSIVGDVNSDPSDYEVQEVIYEEDISDTPEEEEDLDEDES